MQFVVHRNGLDFELLKPKINNNIAMRVFIILYFVAIAYAEKSGYNYQQGYMDADISLASATGSVGSNAPYDASSITSTAEFEKEFFTFSAPENEFDDSNAAHQMVSNLKQALRVIFIKGPENKGLENAALALAKHAVDQRTAIYVLNKQTDTADLANKFNAIAKQTNNKPEVHFVKYRTSEDAANAQKAIQSQYDSLGGSTQSHNDEHAAVHNFASLPTLRAPAPNAPSNSYLPSSILRRRY